MSIASARRVIQIESEAIAALSARIGPEFEHAEEIIANTRGRIIVSGLGKSGLVGRKIAATLSSIGIPSFFVHPVESAHGDMGLIMRGDAAIIISKSGATDELAPILNHCRRMEVPIIAMAGTIPSNLSSLADVTLDISVKCEACTLNMVPTASTTATLAMGDALAVSLLERRGLTEEDFAALHPGGSIGRRLSYRVRDLMVQAADVPIVDIGESMRTVVDAMSGRKLGIAVITENGALAGVITDGDLRRLLQRVDRPMELAAGEGMRRSTRDNTPRKLPLTIEPGAFVARAINIMEQHIVTELVVAEPDRVPLGLIRWIDLSQAGVL